MLSSFLVILFFGNIKTVVSSCTAFQFDVDGRCCPMCSPGFSVFRECTQDSSTSCIPCTHNTYTEEPNGLLKCFPCKNCDEASGLTVLHQCQVFKNTICGPLNGYFCSGKARGGGCDQGQKHTICRAGERVKSQGTAESDTRCEGCPEGTFSTKVMSLICTPWTDCQSEGLAKPGTPASDAECKQPSANTAVIAGTVAGVIALIGALVGALVYKHMHNNKGDNMETEKGKRTYIPVRMTNGTDCVTVSHENSPGHNSQITSTAQTHSNNSNVNTPT